ncbi:MAG: FeoB-associated Cys-rich membrane protein [Flavobacteriaceae bacterium]
MQEVIVYIIVGLAVFYLARKYFFTTSKDEGCNPDCGCS